MDSGIVDPCNEENEFQTLILFDLDLSKQIVRMPPELVLLSSLSALALNTNSINASLTEFLPRDFHQLAKLTFLSLTGNYLSGSIPTEFGLMKSMEHLALNYNGLTGPIPSQLALLTKMTLLDLDQLSLSGSLPSEFGMMTKLTQLYLYKNPLTGVIPSELGLLTNMVSLTGGSDMTGAIPTEFGQMTSLKVLALHHARLTGQIPSEFGLLPGMENVYLEDNDLTGTIPVQVGGMIHRFLPHLIHLSVDRNALTGRVPTELGLLVTNGSLLTLKLANNSLSGSIPEALCSLGSFHNSMEIGLSFDCNDQLCGCCWCPCPGSNYTGECQSLPVHPFNPAEDDEEWPGEYPTAPNAITINIHTDEFPEENSFEWSIQEETGIWKVLDEQKTPHRYRVHSYQQWVVPGSLYRLRLLDIYGDGICCAYGFGWLTITSSTLSGNNTEGSVIWEATGFALDRTLDVYVQTDSNGNVVEVTQVTEEEHDLIHEDGMGGDNMTMPDAVTGNSTNATTSVWGTNDMMG